MAICPIGPDRSYRCARSRVWTASRSFPAIRTRLNASIDSQGKKYSFAGFRMEWSLSPSGNTSTSGKRLRRRAATVRATAPVPKKSIDSHPATGMMYRAASDGAAEAWRIIHALAPTNRKQPASRGRILRRLRWKRRVSGAAVMMFGVVGYPKICKKRNKRKFGVRTSWQ